MSNVVKISTSRVNDNCIMKMSEKKVRFGSISCFYIDEACSLHYLFKEFLD